MRRRVRTIFSLLWFPVSLLLFAEIILREQSNRFFVEPSRIVDTLVGLGNAGWLVQTVFPTLWVVSAGYVTGAVAGVALGAVIGQSPVMMQIVGPVAVLLRSTPSAATIPVILAVFGLGTVSLIVAVSAVVGFQILLITMLGVARTEPTLLHQAGLLHLSPVRTLFFVRLPAATGEILVALQSALQAAILVTVTIEIMAGGQGVGGFTSQALSTMRLNYMWVSVVVMGAIGFLFHELFHRIERQVSSWYFLEKGGR